MRRYPFSIVLISAAVVALCIDVAAKETEASSLDTAVSDAAVRVLFDLPTDSATSFLREAAPENALPYVVGLREWRSHDHLCTGALISQRWVVTSASCVNIEEADGYLEGGSVYVGGIDLEADESALIPVEQIIIHPDYEVEEEVYDARYDIALVELTNPVEQRPVRLPDPTEGCCMDHTLVTAGWPAVAFRGPHELEMTMMALPYLPFEECSPFLQEFVGELPDGVSFTAEDTLCLEGASDDWCVDEGSPLVLPSAGFDVLIGLPSRVATTCRFGDPFFFTRVAPLTSWILAVEGVEADVLETFDQLIVANPGDAIGPRIALGVDAVPGLQPFVAAVLENGSHRCTGVLIRKDWVLTPHACWRPTPSNTEVLIGGLQLASGVGSDPDGERIGVVGAVADDTTGVSLLQLSSNSTQPPLSRIVWERNIEEDDLYVVYGWGRITRGSSFSSMLQVAQMPIAPSDACDEMGEGMICAGAESGSAQVCAGDVGAPLVKMTALGSKLVGIRVAEIGVSGCNIGPTPFISAASLHSWIRKTIRSA